MIVFNLFSNQERKTKKAYRPRRPPVLVLCGGRVGHPYPGWGGCTPILPGGYPILARGYPYPGWGGVPPVMVWDTPPPDPDKTMDRTWTPVTLYEVQHFRKLPPVISSEHRPGMSSNLTVPLSLTGPYSYFMTSKVLLLLLLDLKPFRNVHYHYSPPHRP